MSYGRARDAISCGSVLLGRSPFAGILLFLFGKLPTFVGHYDIKARFDNAGGITIHARCASTAC